MLCTLKKLTSSIEVENQTENKTTNKRTKELKLDIWGRAQPEAARGVR